MLDFISVTDIGYELNLCFLKSLMRKIKDDLVLKNALWYFLLSNNLIMQMRFFLYRTFKELDIVLYILAGRNSEIKILIKGL